MQKSMKYGKKFWTVFCALCMALFLCSLYGIHAGILFP